MSIPPNVEISEPKSVSALSLRMIRSAMPCALGSTAELLELVEPPELAELAEPAELLDD